MVGRKYQVVFCPGQGDIEQSLAFLAVGVGDRALGQGQGRRGLPAAVLVAHAQRHAGSRVHQVRRPAACRGVGQVGHGHDRELQALGLVDGHEAHGVGAGRLDGGLLGPHLAAA